MLSFAAFRHFDCLYIRRAAAYFLRWCYFLRHADAFAWWPDAFALLIAADYWHICHSASAIRDYYWYAADVCLLSAASMRMLYLMITPISYAATRRHWYAAAITVSAIFDSYFIDAIDADFRRYTLFLIDFLRFHIFAYDDDFLLYMMPPLWCHNILFDTICFSLTLPLDTLFFSFIID